MRYFTTLLFLLSCFILSGSNYHGELFSFVQPDGSEVDVRLYGSEYYIRAEGLDGYTLVRDTESGWICYARLSDDSRSLVSTKIKYTGTQAKATTLRVDPGVPRHLDISADAVHEIMDQNANRLFGAKDLKAVQDGYSAQSRADEVLEGNLKGLCIVIDFSDEVGTLGLQEYIDLCNGLNYTKYGNNGSLRQYYADISGGLLDYENVVYGIFRAPKTFKQYDDMPYAQGAREILGLALKWIDDQGFDFSSLSINSDGTIQAINMMYTGNPPDWAQGMWFHQGYYGEFAADGVRSGRYNTSPANAPLTIGTIVHENGHMIGKWPDTYKYSNNTGPDGIGAFDVMCATGPSNNPVLPNPYFIDRVGWGHNTDVTGWNTRLRDTANIYSSYTYNNPNNPREFFIFQSRLKTGRSAGIPDEGLTVWHIDRNGDNQTTHHEVYLVHQNNDVENHSGACFRNGRLEQYNYDSQPNSDWYDGNPSGLRLWDFSDKGAIMTYHIGNGPSLGLAYVDYENDSNGDGYLSAGESFDIRIDVTNFEAGLSTDSKVTCTPAGPHADLVTILNPSVEPGEIGPGEGKEIVFNVQLDASLEDFSVLIFRFDVEENGRTDFLEKELIAGRIYFMDSVRVDDCGFTFMDPSGFDSYANNVDLVQTFYAADPSKKLFVQWVEFELEGGAGCQNDYLRVFNGPDISSPLIKKLCGSALPSDILSENEEGALTFRFHSGQNNTFPGWQAKITCVEASSASGISEKIGLSVFPNPAGGTATFYFGRQADYEVQLYDMLGQVMANIPVINDDRARFDTSRLTPGMYLVRVRAGSAMATGKLIVE